MRSSCTRLVEYIRARYRYAVEIGIGHCPDVCLALQEQGLGVFATDVGAVRHDGLRVLSDDVTAPNLSLYHGVDVVYSVRPPLELVPYMRSLARSMHADLIVKPLSSEYPTGGRLVGAGKTAFFLWSSP